MLIKFIHTCIILSMDLTQDDDESEKKEKKIYRYVYNLSNNNEK
jgi:hypothetical protein